MIKSGLRWIAIAAAVVLSSACQNAALRDGGLDAAAAADLPRLNADLDRVLRKPTGA